MAAFFAVHGSDHADILHRLGHMGKVLRDLNAGDRGLNGLCIAAIAVTLLGIERLELAGATLHPQQDARQALFAEFVRLER